MNKVRPEDLDSMMSVISKISPTKAALPLLKQDELVNCEIYFIQSDKATSFGSSVIPVGGAIIKCGEDYHLASLDDIKNLATQAESLNALKAAPGGDAAKTEQEKKDAKKTAAANAAEAAQGGGQSIDPISGLLNAVVGPVKTVLGYGLGAAAAGVQRFKDSRKSPVLPINSLSETIKVPVPAPTPPVVSDNPATTPLGKIQKIADDVAKLAGIFKKNGYDPQAALIPGSKNAEAAHSTVTQNAKLAQLVSSGLEAMPKLLSQISADKSISESDANKVTKLTDDIVDGTKEMPDYAVDGNATQMAQMRKAIESAIKKLIAAFRRIFGANDNPAHESANEAEYAPNFTL